MSEAPDNQRRKPLVSVEFQTEVDISTAIPERRMFLKMYFEARDSGLLADIGDRRWRTLCTLATYMDERGLCYPSQARMAKDLGIYRQRVNERIQELLAYRFQGRPIITIRKARLSTVHGGRWANNVYQILPVTGLQIFGDESSADGESAEEPQNEAAESNVRKAGHRPMSAKPDTGNPDTNQIHSLNQKNVTNVGESETRKGTDETARLTREQFAKAEWLAQTITETIGQPENYRSYFKIAAAAVRTDQGSDIELIFAALGETKERMQEGSIKKTPSQYFHRAVQRRRRDQAPQENGATTSPRQSLEEAEGDRAEARAAREEFLARSRFPGTGTDRE